MTIFLDTNVVPYLGQTSIGFETLLILAQECNQEVALPALVLAESVAHRQRAIEGDFSALRRVYRKAQTYFDGIVQPNLPSPEDLAQDWGNNLSKRIKIVETPKNAFEEAIYREIKRIRPTRDGDGARDAVIWLTIKQLHLQSDSITYFVSENVKDFATNEKITLHEDLQQEIVEHPTPLIYCKSIDALLGKIATESKPGVQITDHLLDQSEEIQKAIRRSIQDDIVLRQVFLSLPNGKEYIASTIILSQYESLRTTTYQVGNRTVVLAEITCNADFTIGILQQWTSGGFATIQHPAELTLFIRFWMRFENGEELPSKAEVAEFRVNSAKVALN